MCFNAEDLLENGVGEEEEEEEEEREKARLLPLLLSLLLLLLLLLTPQRQVQCSECMMGLAEIEPKE